MNVRLLRRIQKQILKEPKQFHMGWWFENALPWTIPNCGTAACVAGWAYTLSKHTTPKKARSRYVNVEFRARDLLGLTLDESILLFFQDYWPTQFKGGRTPLIRARRAVARIDHFIATKGLE